LRLKDAVRHLLMEVDLLFLADPVQYGHKFDSLLLVYLVMSAV
jgi:hypothetical protein